ncbi:MAG: hypothetical protein Q4F21_10795 [Lachnospiraceae bacterium]|nr:hypothetical protein [Lachnospiraceae bacterium]
MRNSVIGICDVNTVYMKKLAEYFMQKADIPLQVMTFSQDRQLFRYLQKGNLDILITGEELPLERLRQWFGVDLSMEFSESPENYRKSGEWYGEGEEDRDSPACSNKGGEEVRKKISWGIELKDSFVKTERSGGFFIKTSRYHSSAELLALVTELIVQNRADSDCDAWKKDTAGRRERNGCMIGIYSPIHRCGKTSLSVLITELLAKKGKSLMICMDHYSEIFAEEDENLADLIYRISGGDNLRSAGEKLCDFELYTDFVREWQGVSYIAASVSAEDTVEISSVQFCNLMDLLRYRSDYEYVVVDFREDMEGIHRILKQCDVVFMPCLEDCSSRSKLLMFEKSLKELMDLEEYEELMKKIHQIQLPYVIEAGDMENYYRELLWSDFGNAAGRLLEQYDVYS